MEELIQRCSWATTDLYKEYHDNEWGKPVHDENKLAFHFRLIEHQLNRVVKDFLYHNFQFGELK